MDNRVIQNFSSFAQNIIVNDIKISNSVHVKVFIYL